MKVSTSLVMGLAPVAKRLDVGFLILSIAHALYDGFSLDLIHSDVQRAYRDQFQPGPLFDRLLAKVLVASDDSDMKDFWRNTVGRFRPALFPRRSTPESFVITPLTARKELRSTTSARAMSNFCKANGVTVSALAQTCWSLVLASRVKRLDVAFGIVLSGRDDAQANQVRFPTMNTVIARAILHGSRRDMLKDTQSSMATISQHQWFPLRKALAMADHGNGPLFDTLFIFQRPNIDRDSNGELSLYESVGGASEVDYPVCVEAEVVGECLMWRNACKDTVLDESGATRLLEELDKVLTDVVIDPDAAAVSFQGDLTKVAGLEAFSQKEQQPKLMPNDSDLSATSGRSDDTDWSEKEVTIRRALAAVSDIPEQDIAKDSTLQHVGLDSISAIKVSSILRQQNMRLRVSDMMKARSIESMASIVMLATPREDEEKQYENGAKVKAPPKEPYQILQDTLKGLDLDAILQSASIAKESAQHVLPASSGQVYMMSTWQASSLFFPTFKYLIRNGTGGLDTLRSCWKALVEAHPILRTLLIASQSETVPFVQVVMTSLDHFNLPEASNRLEHASPAIGPCSPFVYLQAGTESSGCFEVTLHIHHALYDGVSLPILINDLERRIANADSHGPPTAQTSLDTYYKFLAEPLHHAALQDRKNFWSQYLKNVSAGETVELGNTSNVEDRPSCDEISNSRTELFNPSIFSALSGSASPVTGCRVTINVLASVARMQGLSIHSVFLAAYAQIHADLIKRRRAQSTAYLPHDNGERRDIVIGTYLSNRSHDIPNLPSISFPTINLVPLRIHDPLARQLVDVARTIQGDIAAIGENLGRSSTALWEVEGWCGGAVKVDAWVNFLRLPGDDTKMIRGNEDEISSGEVGAVGGTDSERESEGYARVVEGPTSAFDRHGEASDAMRELSLQRFVESNAVRSVYAVSCLPRPIVSTQSVVFCFFISRD